MVINTDMLIKLCCWMSTLAFPLILPQLVLNHIFFIYVSFIGCLHNIASSFKSTNLSLTTDWAFRFSVVYLLGSLFFQTRMQSTTKLKKIMQDSEETCTESDVRNRMQPLKDLLIKTMEHLHTVVEPHVFILICRSFWDQMGKVDLHPKYAFTNFL